MLKTLCNDKTSLILIGLIFFLQSVGLLFSFFHLPVTGDESILMIMAQDIANGARPLLFYSQPYQFPIESYLFAPFADIFEPSISAARLPGWLLRQIGILFIILTILRVFQGRTRHLLLLLVAIPPVYVFILTAFYGIPQYSFMFFGFGLLTYFASVIFSQIHHNQITEKSIKVGHYTLILFSAFFCGLSLSAYSLSLLFVLPFLMVLTFYLIWTQKWHSIITIMLTAMMVIIGLAPKIWVNIQYPEIVNYSLTQSLPTNQALDKLLNLTLPIIIPKLMGANSPTYPIWTHELISYPMVVNYVCLLLFSGLVLLALYRIANNILKWDINAQCLFACYMIGCVLLAIIAFSITARAKDFTPRYLIVSVWLLPFLLGYALSQFKKSTQYIGVIVCILIAFNIINIARAVDKWRAQDFLTRVADTPPLHNEIAKLEKMGITHCFASYLYAHRLTYLSNRNIHCIQPYNERFPGWPLPYRKEFISNPNVTYLMSQTHGTLYSDYGFAIHLQKNNMVYDTARIGLFKRFYNFSFKTNQAKPSDLRIIYYRNKHEAITLQPNNGKVRLVSASNLDLPKSVNIQCQKHNEKDTKEIPIAFLNFYYDGHKPLMFVNNQIIDTTACLRATLSFQ